MSEVLLNTEEAQAVQEGEAAARLLDDPAFLTAIEAVRRECAEGILQSTPAQGAERNDLYNLSRGLSAITEHLLNLSACGESILMQAEAITEQSDDAQDDPGEPSFPF
jgi:hypothetical protein